MQKSNFEKLTQKMYGEDRPYGPADLIRINKVVKLVGTGNKILDVGCYNGFLGKKFIKAGNKVYGVDISKKALEKAEKFGVLVKCADLEKKLPYGSNFFDIIVAAEIIEHLKDTDFFLKEIFRVLKPGGSLVLTTSNLVSFGRRIMYLVGREGYHEASFSYPENSAGHLRYYNKELLLGLLKHHRFEIELFTSDVVNLSADIYSPLRSSLLAKIFPTLGRSLIVKAKKNEETD
jgi:2-polyprenyl-3-methyl-5-hydroxy-6-metoxy-1,4-benzoquinol methylase